MNQELVKKVITVSGVEQKLTSNGLAVTKIKDEKGLNYNIYKLKKDGEESFAHKELAKMSNVLGSQVEVAFQEQKADMNGREITYRTIRIIKPASGESNQQQNTSQMAQNGSLTNANTNQVPTQPSATSGGLQGNTGLINNEPVNKEEIDTDSIPF